MKRLFSVIIVVALVIVFYRWGKNLITSTGTTKPVTTEAASAPVYTKTQTICLDAGHGGEDPGANNNDLTERDINLTVAQAVKQQLNANGYQVFMTRTSNDDTLSNNDRYTFCNNQKATILVSIHHNYFDDESVDYSTALYYKDADQALAQTILNSVATGLKLDNDGISQFEDGVLSKSTMPAAVIEGFFITNTHEYNVLSASGSTRLADEATAIATGIMNYFTNPIATINPSTNPVLDRNDL